jgi:hypothetical protein
MSATRGTEQHSRNSSKTDIPDLEKGEARPEKEEEEIIEEKVSLFQQFVETCLTTCRSHNKLKMKSAQILRSTSQERVRERINYHRRNIHCQTLTIISLVGTSKMIQKIHETFLTAANGLSSPWSQQLPFSARLLLRSSHQAFPS